MLYRLINVHYPVDMHWRALVKDKMTRKPDDSSGEKSYCGADNYKPCEEMSQFFTDYPDQQVLKKAKSTGKWNEAAKVSAINRHNSNVGRQVSLSLVSNSFSTVHGGNWQH